MWSQWKRWIFYPILWALCMLVPMLVMWWSATGGVASKTNDFTITRFDATYQAHRASDGGLALDVTERITADFPNADTNHGIIRNLDTSYAGHDIGIGSVSVTDGEGNFLQSSRQTDSRGRISLRIGDPYRYVFGTQTYVLSYRIAHAMVLDPDGGQEVYLDVNGLGWLQSFTHVRATLVVPSDLAGQLDGTSACYRGASGSTARCTITRSGSTFTASADQLGPSQTMTIAVGFQPDTVASTVPLPPRQALVWWQLAALPGFGLVLLAFALVMRRIRQRPRGFADPDAAVQFTAPDQLPAVVAADFLGVPERGIAAEVAQLVVQGAVEVTSDSDSIGTSPQQRSGLGRRDKQALLTDLAVRVPDPEKLPKGELRQLVTTLFGKGDPQRLDTIPDYNVTLAMANRRLLFDASSLRREARLPGPLFVISMIALVIGGWVCLGLGIPGLGWWFLLAGVVAVLLVVAATHYYPRVGRLTPDGKALVKQLAGLRRFVLMAEADRIAWMQNAVDAPRVSASGGGAGEGSLVKLYEPLLPYAIIFGAEKTWTDLLGSLYQTFGGGPQFAAPDLTWFALDPYASGYGFYDRRNAQQQGWWQSRPSWGDGSISSGFSSITQAIDDARTSSTGNGDSGGKSWWNSGGGGGGSSWSSGGSSGGGFSGGGMGGGGGGGW